MLKTSLVFFCVASVTGGGFSCRCFFFSVVFFTIFLFLWLVEFPLALLLDGEFE